MKMPRKNPKTKESIALNRDAQRRSRARRREIVEDLQRRVAEYEQRGVQATLEMQRAARVVMEENRRLREVLTGCTCGAVGEFQLSLASEEPRLGEPPLGGLMGAGLTEGPGNPGSEREDRNRVGRDSEVQFEVRGGDAAVDMGIHHGGGGYERTSEDGGVTEEMADVQGTNLENGGNHHIEDNLQDARDPALAKPDRVRIAYICDGVPDEQCCPAEPEPEPEPEPPAGASRPTNCRPPRETDLAQRMPPAADETRCDEAVSILVELQEGRAPMDPAQARAALGCGSVGDCVVKNTRLFQAMDEMS